MPDASSIDRLRARFDETLSSAASDTDLKALRDQYLGRKGGAIAALMKEVASAPPEARPALGRLANELKTHIEAALAARTTEIAASRAPAGSVDVTLPGRVPLVGRRHPLTVLRERIEGIFARQGYEILDGPETEDDWHNFEALNMPPDHPARDMQDTLYLRERFARPWPVSAGADTNAGRAEAREPASLAAGAEAPALHVPARGAVSARPEAHLRGKDADVGPGLQPRPDKRPSADQRAATLLRTHTSAMQIRYMETHRPPVRVIAPGRVYRRDNLDLTHTPMFQQVEGLVVGERVTMADLKGTIIGSLRELFGPDTRVMFRPSFFPYTEPSADVFIGCRSCGGAGCAVCKRTGWLEVLGCGMVHPAVFEAVGYDPAVTGFAFGIGIERLAMLLYGVDDIRQFYENDLRFLEQFSV
jgi:phenylalanyl-tRNA synthetase alpha chain